MRGNQIRTLREVVCFMKHWSIAFLVLLVLLLCTVSATAAENEFSFDRSVTTVYEGETLATILNRSGDAAQGEVTYVSSAEKNATVDAAGVVTGLQKGKTTITATSKDASSNSIFFG